MLKMKNAVVIGLIGLVGCSANVEKNSTSIIPKAKKVPYILKEKNGTRIDNYYWMRDKKWTDSRQSGKKFKDMNAEVKSHLSSEKNYSDKYLHNIKDESKKVFEEIKKRIPGKDQQVPYLDNGYMYYARYEQGKEYPFFCRKKDNLESKEEIYLNPNKLAKGAKVFKVGIRSISPDNKILAYGVDTRGNRLYTLYFKDLETGKLIDKKLENVSSNFLWGADSDHFYLSSLNKKSLRSEKILRYDLKSLTKEIIYHEKDNKFGAWVTKSRSKKFVYIYVGSSDSSEIYYFNASNPKGMPKLFRKRENKHKYDIDHIGKRIYIKSNKYNTNYSLYHISDSNLKSKWTKFSNYNKDVYLQGYELFEDYIVLLKRERGSKAFDIFTHDKKVNYVIDQPDSGSIVYFAHNREPKSKKLRFYYETPTTPEQVIEWGLESKTRKILKTKRVGGNYNPTLYSSERRFVKVRDGAEVPVTIIKKKSTKFSQKTPVLLYGYGSYGTNIEPYFRSHLISLLDRGFVYIIAHVRGSSFLGRSWYLDGKYLKKKNTFNDFVDIASYLVDKKMTTPRYLYASGGSAGGLLMGAIVNDRPDLFDGIIAAVPFVDSLTTMLDEELPLTTQEYEEWGNPNNKKYYDYMESYSPYDNIKSVKYPKILAKGSIHDTQVGYWEPAKWVAKLRDEQLDKMNPILFKVELETGHSGESGRFKRYKDIALNYALLEYWAK